MDIRLEVIQACFAENQISENDKNFLEEKWIEAQRKGGSEEDINGVFDKMMNSQYGPRVGSVRNALMAMEAKLLANKKPVVQPVQPVQSVSQMQQLPSGYTQQQTAPARHVLNVSESTPQTPPLTLPQIAKLLVPLKAKGRFGPAEADRLQQIIQESSELFPKESPQAMEHFERRVKQEFGPQSFQMLGLFRLAQQHILESQRKNEEMKAAMQSQQKMQAAQQNAMYLPQGLLPPVGTQSINPQSQVAVNQAVAKKMDAKPGAPTTESVFSEVVKLNPEGEDGLIVSDHRFVVQQTYAGEEQDTELRGVSRHRMEQEARVADHGDGETDLESDGTIANNVLNAEHITRFLNRGNSDLQISAEAKRVLSEGVQTHLKNLVEAAVRLSHTRLNRRPFLDHFVNFNVLSSSPDGVEKLSDSLALKWAPNVREVLFHEERTIQHFLELHRKDDENLLLGDMRNADAEANAQVVGVKRKSPDGDQWWERDAAADAKGTIAWSQMPEVLLKMKVAENFSLGPYKKKAAPVVKPVDMDNKPPVLVPVSRNRAVIPPMEAQLSSSVGKFEDQMQFCNEVLQKRSVEVTKDDIFEVIQKAGMLSNDNNSRKFIAYWKPRK